MLTFITTTWKVRHVGDSVNDKTDAADDEAVELEKSNILLMGPTGSGNVFCIYHKSSVMFVLLDCDKISSVELLGRHVV